MEKKDRKKVFVSSPFRGEHEAENVQYAKACAIDSIYRGEAPLVSHLLYPRFLNDGLPTDREMGIECSLLWLRFAEILAVYIDRDVSEGMHNEIREAINLGIFIDYRSIKVSPPSPSERAEEPHMGLNFATLQQQVGDWSKRNFGEHDGTLCILGALEELGELSHAHLKNLQNIRTTEPTKENKADAVADTIVYLADYCSREEIDLQTTMDHVWAKVRQRNWVEHPDTAHLDV